MFPTDCRNCYLISAVFILSLVSNNYVNLFTLFSIFASLSCILASVAYLRIHAAFILSCRFMNLLSLTFSSSSSSYVLLTFEYRARSSLLAPRFFRILFWRCLSFCLLGSSDASSSKEEREIDDSVSDWNSGCCTSSLKFVGGSVSSTSNSGVDS